MKKHSQKSDISENNHSSEESENSNIPVKIENNSIQEKKSLGNESGIALNKFEKKISDLEKQLEEAKQKINELHDKWLRSIADLDNFRKRTVREKGEWRDFYHEEILEEILPVLDNFDRALLTPLESEETKKFAEGMILVDKQLHEILSKHGLKEIEAMGKSFDPHYHEAVMMFETDDYPDHTIIEEIRKGYLKGDKVIRPALVKVSQKKEVKTENIATEENTSNEKSESS